MYVCVCACEQHKKKIIFAKFLYIFFILKRSDIDIENIEQYFTF